MEGSFHGSFQRSSRSSSSGGINRDRSRLDVRLQFWNAAMYRHPERAMSPHGQPATSRHRQPAMSMHRQPSVSLSRLPAMTYHREPAYSKAAQYMFARQCKGDATCSVTNIGEDHSTPSAHQPPCHEPPKDIQVVATCPVTTDGEDHAPAMDAQAGASALADLAGAMPEGGRHPECRASRGGCHAGADVMLTSHGALLQTGSEEAPGGRTGSAPATVESRGDVSDFLVSATSLSRQDDVSLKSTGDDKGDSPLTHGTCGSNAGVGGVCWSSISHQRTSALELSNTMTGARRSSSLGGLMPLSKSSMTLESPGMKRPFGSLGEFRFSGDGARGGRVESSIQSEGSEAKLVVFSWAAGERLAKRPKH